MTKLYEHRDLMLLDAASDKPRYAQHVQAMTAEKLHAKSDIAAELAYRDTLLDILELEVFGLLADAEASVELLDKHDAELGKDMRESIKQVLKTIKQRPDFKYDADKDSGV